MSSRSRSPRDLDKSSVHSLKMRTSSTMSTGSSEIEDLVEAISSNHMTRTVTTPSSLHSSNKSIEEGAKSPSSRRGGPGSIDIAGPEVPIRPINVDKFDMDIARNRRQTARGHQLAPAPMLLSPPQVSTNTNPCSEGKLRVLIVEVRHSILITS